MLMIPMSLDSDLVKKWVIYVNLNFWYANCFHSIRACYLELDQINVGFVFYVKRSFDPYTPCLILEIFLMLLRRTQRRRRWKPPFSTVLEQYHMPLVRALGLYCRSAHNLCVLRSNPLHDMFEIPIPFYFPNQNAAFYACRAYNHWNLCSNPGIVIL